MKCSRCGDPIAPGDEMDYNGQALCEDCYMRALSPARACDPWAVRSAQVLTQIDARYADLSETQTAILRALEETGGLEAALLADRLQMQLPDLERELATLRHMEKVRGALRAGRKIVCLWES